LKAHDPVGRIVSMEPRPRELVFDVLQDQDGGFVAECIGENIITEADTWQELRDQREGGRSGLFL
jgi:hypothetical protein